MADESTTVVNPTQEDVFVRGLSEVAGGPMGEHAARPRPGAKLLTPARVVMVLAVLVFCLHWVQKSPCQDGSWQNFSQYRNFCYTDVLALYYAEHLSDGAVPYYDWPVEYPVLTGAFMEVAAQITWVITGDPHRDFSAALKRQTAGTFFVVNVLLLFMCALVLVGFTLATARGVARRPGGARGQPNDALFVAAAPVLALTSTINWDLFAVALTAVAMWAWARGRPVLFGILLGIGTAAKFYPFLLLGPLLIVCIRRREISAWLMATIATVASWVAVNAPVYLLAKEQWLSFWDYNKNQRLSDYGSIWYVFKLADHEFANVNQLSLVIFVFFCVAIAVLGLLAPQPPRFAQLAFLTVAAFLLVNKVYSPQYVLWLLPLVALARPVLRDWLIWQFCEVFYWMMVWLHLAGFLAPGQSNAPDKIYWFAVILRLAGTMWLMAMVTRDILDPRHDPVRQHGLVDDPGGGVLVRAH